MTTETLIYFAIALAGIIWLAYGPRGGDVLLVRDEGRPGFHVKWEHYE